MEEGWVYYTEAFICHKNNQDFFPPLYFVPDLKYEYKMNVKQI